MVDAVTALRRARRRRSVVRPQRADVAYRLYVAALLGVIAVWVLAHLPAGRAASGRLLAATVHQGPGVLGIVVAAAVAAAVTSGARGGPLVLEAPDVHHLLLAPLPFGRTLLRAAARRVQLWVLAWAAAGAVAGVGASHEFPGHLPAWVAAGAAWGALVGAAGVGAALVTSGRQVSRRSAALVAAACLLWAGAGAATRWPIDPFTLVARVALLPLAGGGWVFLMAVPAAGLVVAGLRSVGGVSLEAALHRACLARQLRFALSVRDLSTAVLLGRAMIDERPRRRPWIRTGRGRGRRLAVWKRDCQAILRWPTRRIVRELGFGVVAGGALRAVLAGTTPMLVVAGAALWLGAVCSDSGLVAEVQHAEQGRCLPVRGGRLLVRHLPSGVATMAVILTLGGLAGSQLGGWDLRAFRVVGLVVAPAAVAAVAGASITTVRSVLEPLRMFGWPQEVVAVQLLVAESLPPAVATAGVLPAWAVHRYGGSALGDVLSWSRVPVGVALLVVVWLWLRGLDQPE